jgi:hypothetical protein
MQWSSDSVNSQMVGHSESGAGTALCAQKIGFVDCVISYYRKLFFQMVFRRFAGAGRVNPQRSRAPEAIAATTQVTSSRAAPIADIRDKQWSCQLDRSLLVAFSRR